MRVCVHVCMCVMMVAGVGGQRTGESKLAYVVEGIRKGLMK